MKGNEKAVYGTKSGGGSSGQSVRPNANNSFHGKVQRKNPRKKTFGTTKTC